MNGVNEEKLVTVFSGGLWQAQLVKGLLDANAVKCELKDNSGILTSSYAIAEGEVAVIVNEADEDLALKVIEENTIPEAPDAE
mgnify:CR=1 FL=1